MANPNFQLLVDAAKLLKPILGELVFVSGCTTGLLITDKGAADVRPTYDADAIAEITSYVQYAGFSEGEQRRHLVGQIAELNVEYQPHGSPEPRLSGCGSGARRLRKELTPGLRVAQGHCFRESWSFPWLCFLSRSSRGFALASGFCWRMAL
jgi:hypothetical protein